MTPTKIHSHCLESFSREKGWRAASAPEFLGYPVGCPPPLTLPLSNFTSAGAERERAVYSAREAAAKI